MVLALAFGLAAAGARAGWACADAFGNRYVLLHPVGELAGLQCEAQPDGVPEPAAPPPGLPSPGPRGGLLVLAPPARRGAPYQATGPASAAFDPLIESVARSTGQDADLLRAIVQVESHFDPAAVSPKGAIGLMQVMPATAAAWGLADPQRALFQPESNLRIGALYLRHLTEQFPGTLELAIAAYNAGEGAVVRHGFAVPPYPQTQDYVRDVLGIYTALRAAR